MSNKLPRNLYQIRKNIPPPKIIINNDNNFDLIDKISKLEKRNRRLINDNNDLQKRTFFLELILNEKNSIIDKLINKKL